MKLAPGSIVKRTNDFGRVQLWTPEGFDHTGSLAIDELAMVIAATNQWNPTLGPALTIHNTSILLVLTSTGQLGWLYSYHLVGVHR